MPDSNAPIEVALREIRQHLGVDNIDYVSRPDNHDMANVRKALWKFCHDENRRLLDDNLALTDERDKYYEAWRTLYNRHSDNIRALTRMAVTLLQTGFRGTGVDEGVEWLAQQNKDLAAAVTQLEEMLKDAESRSYLNSRGDGLGRN